MTQDRFLMIYGSKICFIQGTSPYQTKTLTNHKGIFYQNQIVDKKHTFDHAKVFNDPIQSSVLDLVKMWRYLAQNLTFGSIFQKIYFSVILKDFSVSKTN